MSDGTFIDQYLPISILGAPCRVQPRFSTRIVEVKSGDENRNRNWLHPKRHFVFPEAVTELNFEDALDCWLCFGGPEVSFPMRDPVDFASAPLTYLNTVPVVSGSDQQFGVTDGLTYQYQLTKTRTFGRSYTRLIYLPILSPAPGEPGVTILMNGVLPSAVPPLQGGPYSVTSISRPGGVATFSPIPQAGIVLTWGGLFDTEVRWAGDDSWDEIVHSLETAGSAELDFVEVRRC